MFKINATCFKKNKRVFFSLMAFAAIALTFIIFLNPAIAGDKKNKKTNPRVAMDTTMGKIIIELWPDKAPVTVKNFLDYADASFYDNKIFHRVIPGFMIQGGGFDKNLKKYETKPPIKNEAGNSMKNNRGTIAMARTNVVDSATCQFFINLKNNDFLNQRDKSARGFGYAVFGKVISGMDVVDKIAASPTTRMGGHGNVPVTPVIIKSVKKL